MTHSVCLSSNSLLYRQHSTCCCSSSCYVTESYFLGKVVIMKQNLLATSSHQKLDFYYLEVRPWTNYRVYVIHALILLLAHVEILSETSSRTLQFGPIFFVNTIRTVSPTGIIMIDINFEHLFIILAATTATLMLLLHQYRIQWSIP